MNFIRVQSRKIGRKGHDFAQWNDSSGEPMVFSYAELSNGKHYIFPVDQYSCSFCDEPIQFAKIDGRIEILNGQCPAEDGYTTVVKLNVPSGIMIVSDSLDLVFSSSMDGLNYNSMKGQAKFVKRMESIGCAYGPVLNTSPYVYKKPDGTYVIVNAGYDEQNDLEVDFPSDWIEVADITTDLWAYSFADYENWLKLGGPTIEEDSDYGKRQIFEVEPGVYEFTLHTGEKGFRDYSTNGDPVIFSEFKKID